MAGTLGFAVRHLMRVGPDLPWLGKYLPHQVDYVAIASGLAWASISDSDVTS
jgi:hypothetical protein